MLCRTPFCGTCLSASFDWVLRSLGLTCEFHETVHLATRQMGWWLGSHHPTSDRRCQKGTDTLGHIQGGRMSHSLSCELTRCKQTWCMVGDHPNRQDTRRSDSRAYRQQNGWISLLHRSLQDDKGKFATGRFSTVCTSQQLVHFRSTYPDPCAIRRVLRTVGSSSPQ